MFHCNGWTFTWGVAAMAGTNIIMRNMETKTVYDLIARRSFLVEFMFLLVGHLHHHLSCQKWKEKDLT
jgi:hypothetical protein